MYTLSFPSETLRKDGIEIPRDDRLPAYKEYVAWLAEGNGPQVVDDGPVFPRIQVTAWQFIQALAEAALLETVEAAANASDNLLIRMGWQRAPNFWSDDALVLAMADGIGLSRAQLQQIFERAASF